MHVLLLRPVPVNERFGLGPFFRIEPLGMAYIAAALERQGHTATIADLRFSRSVEHYLRTERPGLVGIAGMHALETDNVIELAARVRRASPDVPILIGGHTASAYPAPFLTADVTAVVVDDGERAVPQVVAALERRQPLASVPGLVMRDDAGGRHAHRRPARDPHSRRSAEAGAAPGGPLAQPVRVPGAPARLVDRNGPRLSVPLLVLLDLAAARPHRA